MLSNFVSLVIYLQLQLFLEVLELVKMLVLEMLAQLISFTHRTQDEHTKDMT